MRGGAGLGRQAPLRHRSVDGVLCHQAVRGPLAACRRQYSELGGHAALGTGAAWVHGEVPATPAARRCAAMAVRDIRGQVECGPPTPPNSAPPLGTAPVTVMRPSGSTVTMWSREALAVSAQQAQRAGRGLCSSLTAAGHQDGGGQGGAGRARAEEDAAWRLQLIRCAGKPKPRHGWKASTKRCGRTRRVRVERQRPDAAPGRLHVAAPHLQEPGPAALISHAACLLQEGNARVPLQHRGSAGPARQQPGRGSSKGAAWPPPTFTTAPSCIVCCQCKVICPNMQAPSFTATPPCRPP